MPGHIPPWLFRPTWNGTTPKYCLTHYTRWTWHRVIIGYFRHLRKPFGVGTLILTMKSSLQRFFNSLFQEDDQCQVGGEDGEVCEVRRPVLRESAYQIPPLPILVVIVKVMLARFKINLFLRNFYLLSSGKGTPNSICAKSCIF